MRLVSSVVIAEKSRRFSPKQGDGNAGFWEMSDGKLVPYSSSIERRFVEICDWAPEVRSIQHEPFRLRFYDEPTQRHRYYTPDYLVGLETSRGDAFRYVIEVKPYSLYMRKFKADLRGFANRAIVAGTSYARNQPGTDFAVVTDRWVESRGVANIRLIRSAALRDGDPALAEIMVNRIFTIAGPSLKDLVNEGHVRGYSRAAVITQVLKMCGCDEVHFDIRQPLSDGSRFYEGARQKVFKI